MPAQAGITAEEGAPVLLRQRPHHHRLNKID
jgi:hypothetical protein